MPNPGKNQLQLDRFSALINAGSVITDMRNQAVGVI
jgi:hypothetical protein